MPKTKRKACDISVVSPLRLWDMYQERMEGRDRYEIKDALGEKFSSDISKVNFDFENFECDHLEERLGDAMGFLGMRKFWTRSPLTCFSYIGCYAGGDWEYPVSFLVYLDKDGKTFRGYIPKEGNVWNYDTKQAFGNDEDADAKFLKKWIKANKPELLDGDDEEDDRDFDTSDAEVMSDPSKMAHEMMFRFEAVKGT